MQTLNDHIEDGELREAIYVDLIPLFEEQCDNLDELLEHDEAFDAAYRIISERDTKHDVIYGIFDDEEDL